MKRYIFLSLMFLIATIAFAQEEDYKRFSHYITDEQMETHSLVIAPSGLKMRQTPDKNGKVIATLPFGTKVKFEEQLEEIPENRQFNLDENFTTYWILVSYGKQKGYCCAAYLGKNILKMTSDYYFSSPYGIGCGESEILVNPNYYTYGVYEDNDRYELKEIKMEFAASMGETRIRVLSEKDDRNINYIIYAKQRMKTGVLKGKSFIPKDGEMQGINDFFTMNYGVQSNISTKKIDLENGKFTLSGKEIMKKNKENGEEYRACSITITEKATGKKYQIGEYYGDNFSIDWAGDLDGDGKLDLILSNNGDNFGSTIFFLSRTTPNGKFLIEAGSIEYYDCC